MVVSQPDKRRGRGAKVEPSPVKRAALGASLTVTDRLEEVGSCGAELGVVVAYGRIIPKRVLDVVPMLNAHFSLLPRWRGAAPVERAILAGDEVTGVCIMRLEEGLDTGPVLARREVEISNRSREHAGALRRRLAALAAEMIVEVLSSDVADLPPGTPQSGEPTYAPKVEPGELRLEFSEKVLDLERIVRLDRAWTTFRGQRLLVLDAVARPDEAATGSASRQDSEGRSSLAPGALDGTNVRAADGMLELLEVQPAGRRALPARDWIRGARPDLGEKLGD
jgi:methionyl-tRNA formyltransferase